MKDIKQQAKITTRHWVVGRCYKSGVTHWCNIVTINDRLIVAKIAGKTSDEAKKTATHITELHNIAL